jgi:hypothetical protein
MFSLEEPNFRQRCLEKLDKGKFKFYDLAYIEGFPAKSYMGKLKILLLRAKDWPK